MADEEHPAAKLDDLFPWQLGEHGWTLFQAALIATAAFVNPETGIPLGFY
jgi:hypothetical protein